MRLLFIIIIGMILDLCFGDPYSFPHIIRMIGSFIGKTDSYFQNRLTKIQEEDDKKHTARLCGGFLVCYVLGVVFILWMLVYVICINTAPGVFFLLECFLAYQLLAMKSLKTESMKVYDALENKEIEQARTAVSMIVGRDTYRLDEEGIAKAAVETVAENASDGVIAPLFYLALGGTLPMLLYKTVNTMDSMIGYKNEKYRYFGTIAARLDDILNFIPARLSGIFITMAAFITGDDPKMAWHIFKRDRKKHASPNSAHGEAAMAGALHLMLAGDAWYFGVRHEKETIGDAGKKISYEDIKRANKLMYVSSMLACILFMIIRYVIAVILIR